MRTEGGVSCGAEIKWDPEVGMEILAAAGAESDRIPGPKRHGVEHMKFPTFQAQEGITPALQDLIDHCRRNGGTIVQYERVVSLLIYMRRYPKYDWVAPHSSRRAVGYKHALWCFLLGWWSITGLLFTPGAIINNVMGGIDVTPLLMSSRQLPDHRATESAVQEYNAALKRQQQVFLGFLVVVLAACVVFLVLPYV